MTQTVLNADLQLKASIIHTLEWAPDINATHIGVSVTDGAVIVSGEVLAYAEKTAAIRAVLTVHGVTSLSDEILVKHSWGARADADISRDVGAAITASALVPPGTVKAAVEDHWITLTGEVHWNFQREAADRVAGDIAGVAGVHNHISLKPNLTFVAQDAKANVKSALVRSALTDAGNIEVTTSGTELVLSGTVHSWSEFEAAATAAWATPGVTFVSNDLTVVP